MMVIGNRPLYELMALLPSEFQKEIQNAGTDELEEIRIREGRPLQLLYCGREKMHAFIPKTGFCEVLLELLTEHALFTRENELSEGYLTVRGGCRVGVAGHYTLRKGELSFARVSSCNIRIAREHKGAADILMPFLYAVDGAPRSTLLLSKPGIGKTTILRDAARQLSNGTVRRGLKVALADERGELAGGCGGIPMLDVGVRTDVVDGCRKAEAMQRLIRSMSPEVIVTDELGSEADAEAAMHASACGTALLASAHAGSIADAMNKTHIRRLIEWGCFEEVLLLQRNGERCVLTPLTRGNQAG